MRPSRRPFQRKGKKVDHMAQEHHWTAENDDAFAHKMAFDFIAQVEKKLAASPVSQIELARRLGVSEGAVSKILNNPRNLTLKTIVKYARALGMKAAIVGYDDQDPKNENGPVGSEIFTTCWERAGKPRDIWALEAPQVQRAAKTKVASRPIRYRLRGRDEGGGAAGKPAAKTK
jgi:transcriptional regulator with XRE-family HTH domain